MTRTYTASRISQGNQLFPPTIILTDEGVTVRAPALVYKDMVFVPYNAISSVEIHTPLVGYSSIRFYAYVKEIHIHGFYQNEVQEMKAIIMEMQYQ